MTITLPLQPQEEARLDKILAEAPEISPDKQPTHSLRGLLSKYGPVPSAEEIDRNRAEMFESFPRSDF